MKKTAFALGLAALLSAPAAATQPAGQQRQVRAPSNPGELGLYQGTNFSGDDYVVDGNRTSVRTQWNIRSIAIHPGERWEICAKPRYVECIVLDRSLPDASEAGITAQIGSARRAPPAR